MADLIGAIMRGRPPVIAAAGPVPSAGTVPSLDGGARSEPPPIGRGSLNALVADAQLAREDRWQLAKEIAESKGENSRWT